MMCQTFRGTDVIDSFAAPHKEVVADGVLAIATSVPIIAMSCGILQVVSRAYQK